MRRWQLLLALAPAWLGVGKAFGATVPAYDVRGVAIHQCSCPYACPCMFENAPMRCALAAVYHLDSGTVGGVDVAGLFFVSVDGVPPSGGQENAQNGVIYLDNRATPAQRRALLLILKDHGEWPNASRPVEVVPIQFSPTATGYTTTIPGLFRGEVVQVKSRVGTPISVDGVGFAEGPRWVVGRSTVNDLHDSRAGIRWSLPDTNGSWTLLHWTHSERVGGALGRGSRPDCAIIVTDATPNMKSTMP